MALAIRGRYWRHLALTGVLTLLVAAAAPLVTISPIYHQLVMFSLPTGFKGAEETSTPTFYRREHIRDSETLDHWTQMITVTGAQGLVSNPKATPQAFAEVMGAGFRRICPDTFASLALGDETVDGQQGFAVVLSCGHVQAGANAYSETVAILAVKGTRDYYTFQWAERGADSGKPLSLDREYWRKQLSQLDPIRLCPIVPGEQAPYPSCAGRK